MVKTLLLCGVYLSLSLVWAVPCNGSGEGRADPTTPPVVSASPRLDRPQVFAPGIISTEDDEAGGVFNPDQTEFYFAKFNPYTTYPRIGLLCVSRWRNHQWSDARGLAILRTMARLSSPPLNGWEDPVLRVQPACRRLALAGLTHLVGRSARRHLGRPGRVAGSHQPGDLLELGAIGRSSGHDVLRLDPRRPRSTQDLPVATGERAIRARRGPGARDQSGFQSVRPVHLARWEVALLCLFRGRRDRRTRVRRKRSPRVGSPILAATFTSASRTTASGPRARHLGSGVNTFADESYPALSPDGKLLFFTTERSRFTVPAERRLDMNELEGALHSLENGHGNISFIAVDALQQEVRP